MKKQGGILGVGMACANDSKGLWGTLNNLREERHFSGDIYVVDNDPETAEGASIKATCEDYGAIHIPMPHPKGTSAPRDRIFQEAITDWVLVIDSHVTVPQLGRLTYELESNRISGDDLFHGPIMFGRNKGYATHFRDEWGADAMWGRWGLAWQSKDRKGPIFDIRAETGDDGGRMLCSTVEMNPQPIDIGLEIPFSGSYKGLLKNGYLPLGALVGDQPFEIPGMGMGLYLSRRESWLGFHPLATGFGGEEMTIHELYREHGRKVICLPWLNWWHRFAADKTDPGYRLEMRHRARNYALSIGRLKSKDKHWPRLAEAMIKKLGQVGWNQIAQNPEKDCDTCGNGTAGMPFEQLTANEMVEWVRNHPRDIDKQVDNLQKVLAGQSEITLIVKRCEWDIVAASTGASVISYNREVIPAVTSRVHALWPNFAVAAAAWPAEIAECDALILDTEPHADRLYNDLDAFASSVRKRIVIHATHQKGEMDGERVGLLPGLRAWLRTHQEWQVVFHSDAGYGLTVISRDPQDKKPLPTLAQQAINFTKAMAYHAASGAKTVSEETAQVRLDTCALCPNRAGDRCTMCGCYLASKAVLQTSECPAGYWEIAEREQKPFVPSSI